VGIDPLPEQLQQDFDTLTHSWSGTSKINDVSPLGVFGPAAFAVVEADPGAVAMAGVRIGKGRAIICGHQVWAGFSNLTQHDDKILASNMMTWLKRSGGKVLATGQVCSQCRCYPLLLAIAHAHPLKPQDDHNSSLEFFKQMGFSGADFVDDKRLHPSTPWDSIPNFAFDNYDVVIMRRVEDFFGNGQVGVPGYVLNETRVQMAKEWIEAGGSAIMTGRVWEWISVKKYNQHTGLRHPINVIAGEVGVTVGEGTIHQSGKNGTIGKAPNIQDSNLLYTLKYVNGLSAAELEQQENMERQAYIYHALDPFLANVPLLGVLKQTSLVNAITSTMTTAVCNEQLRPKLNLNPTFNNSIKSRDVRSRTCLTLLSRARDLTEQEWKDTNVSLRYFPGAVPDSVPTVHGYKSLPDTSRPAWSFTGVYAKPGAAVTVAINPAEGLQTLAGLTPPLTILIGHLNFEPDSFEPYQRFPRLCMSRTIDAASTNRSSVTFTSFMGGMVYVMVDSNWHGKALRLTIDNAVLAPYFVLGTTSQTAWEAAREYSAPFTEIQVAETVFTIRSELLRAKSFAEMSKAARFWDTASCHVINFLRHIPDDPMRELTRYVVQYIAHYTLCTILILYDIFVV
jgi:hypothetical protein